MLEINPQHPLVQKLNANPDDPALVDWAEVLFTQAVLTLGARVDDPTAFVTRLNDLLVSLATAPPAERQSSAKPQSAKAPEGDSEAPDEGAAAPETLG